MLKVSDLALVATLSLYFSVDFLEVEEDKHRVLFVFLRNPDLDELIQMYWCGELKVEPQEYFNQLKSIKRLRSTAKHELTD